MPSTPRPSVSWPTRGPRTRRNWRKQIGLRRLDSFGGIGWIGDGGLRAHSLGCRVLRRPRGQDPGCGHSRREEDHADEPAVPGFRRTWRRDGRNDAVGLGGNLQGHADQRLHDRQRRPGCGSGSALPPETICFSPAWTTRSSSRCSIRSPARRWPTKAGYRDAMCHAGISNAGLGYVDVAAIVDDLGRAALSAGPPHLRSQLRALLRQPGRRRVLGRSTANQSSCDSWSRPGRLGPGSLVIWRNSPAHGSSNSTHPRRGHQAARLPRRRHGQPQRPRQPGHRDARPLQPAHRSCRVRGRRREDQELAGQGRAAVRHGRRACCRAPASSPRLPARRPRLPRPRRSPSRFDAERIGEIKR